MPYGEWLTAMPPPSLNTSKKIRSIFAEFFLGKNMPLEHASFSPKYPQGKLLIRTPLGVIPRPIDLVVSISHRHSITMFNFANFS